jgi:dTDP-4-amino-4,6-dideoxygalactose transaminase
MKVPRYNYPQQFGVVDDLITDLRSMLLNGRYILAEEVVNFEREFAQFLGVAHVRGTNTATDALALILMALGIGPSDEVITHANTFNATVTAIRMVGANPVLVDADEKTYLIDVSQLDAAITPRTKALLPVHLYGKPSPMLRLLSIAERGGIHVIEDAAQAHGARIAGRRVGGFGIAGCFSFHPSKNLAAAGDAGAVVTNDERLAKQIAMMRALGQRNQNEHIVAGINSKMDSVQARILSWKLPHLEEWNARRQTVACWYRERLADLPVSFQAEDSDEEHVYHLFQVRTDRRDALLHHLQGSGVDAIVRYPTPIHLQPAFADMGWKAGQFPVAERLAAELLCLPIRPDLSVSEADYVSECMHSFFKTQSHTAGAAVSAV